MTAVRFVDFSARVRSQTILHGITATAPSGVLTAVLGPNGSGKSTLLSALTGGGARMTGRVLVGGRDILTMRASERSKTASLLAQEHAPVPDLTVAEMVELGLPAPTFTFGARGQDFRRRRSVVEALRDVGADDLVDRDVVALSGGERQRVLLARAVVADPPVVVLDEPTNHLEPRYQLDVLARMRDSGRTVLAALHTLDLAAQFADHAIVLGHGTVVASGRPEAVLTPGLLADVFGVDGEFVGVGNSDRKMLLIRRRSAT